MGSSGASVVTTKGGSCRCGKQTTTKMRCGKVCKKKIVKRSNKKNKKSNSRKRSKKKYSGGSLFNYIKNLLK